MSCYSFNDAGETKGSMSSRKEAAAQRLEAYRVAPRLCSRCSLYLQLLLSLQAPLLLDKWISVKHQQELLKSNLTLHQVHTAQANVVFTTTRQQLQKLLKRSRRFFSPMTSHLASLWKSCQSQYLWSKPARPGLEWRYCGHIVQAQRGIVFHVSHWSVHVRWLLLHSVW